MAPWFVNRFEGVQWTMVYEIRGSMFVFMTLIVICPFTPFYRRAALVFLTAWAIHFDENVLLTIPFLLGTLLAELSYVAKPAQHWWPLALAVVALFFASYPPDSPHKAAWSQYLRSYAEAIIPNEHGIIFWNCGPNAQINIIGHTHGLVPPS